MKQHPLLRIVRQDPGCLVVAVSGLHRGESPQPGSAVIAALRRANPRLRVVGLAYDSLESGLYSQGEDAADVAYTMPYPSAGRDAWLSRLAEVHRRERLDALIPCLDTEIDLLAPAHDELDRMGVRAWLPQAQSVRSRDKTRLDCLAREAGCPVPGTRVVTDLAALHAAAGEFGGTVFVKGRLYEAVAASTPWQLEAAFQRMKEKWGAPVLVQECIEGEEFNVVGLGDGAGGIIGHCAIRKMLRTASGKGYAGIVVVDDLLMARSRALIAALKWRGPFELEFVACQSRRDFFLIEINPRFPAWVGFPAALGCNLPAVALDHALGRMPLPQTSCEPGSFFVRHCVDVTGKLDSLVSLATVGMFARDADAGSVRADSNVSRPPATFAAATTPANS